MSGRRLISAALPKGKVETKSLLAIDLPRPIENTNMLVSPATLCLSSTRERACQTTARPKLSGPSFRPPSNNINILPLDRSICCLCSSSAGRSKATSHFFPILLPLLSPRLARLVSWQARLSQQACLVSRPKHNKRRASMAGRRPELVANVINHLTRPFPEKGGALFR